MAIIELTLDQVERILPCAVEYTDIIPDMEFNADNYVNFWKSTLASGAGVIYVSEDDNGVVKGGIGGIKYPEPLSGRMTAVEMFWYTKKDSRGDGIKLYKKFENWARDSGCKRIAMIYLPCSMPEELSRFYSRLGFNLLEMHYEKSL